MKEFKINYSFQPGDPVWFMYENEISKGVIDRIQIRAENNGLSSRGYKVREFFNKILPVPIKDKKLYAIVEYSVDLLYFEKETYRSCPHLFKEHENKLFPSKKDLLKSLNE